MNLGRELYARGVRHARQMLFLFAGIGIFASVSIIALISGMHTYEYILVSAASLIILGVASLLNKDVEKSGLVQVYMLSLVNVALLLLLLAYFG